MKIETVVCGVEIEVQDTGATKTIRMRSSTTKDNPIIYQQDWERIKTTVDKMIKAAEEFKDTP